MAKEFSDTNEAGRRYKTPKATKQENQTTRRTERREASSESSEPSHEDRIRSDLKNYRKRVLQAPGRAAGMSDD